MWLYLNSLYLTHTHTLNKRVYAGKIAEPRNSPDGNSTYWSLGFGPNSEKAFHLNEKWRLDKRFSERKKKPYTISVEYLDPPVKARLHFLGCQNKQGHDYDLVQEFFQLLPCILQRGLSRSNGQ